MSPIAFTIFPDVWAATQSRHTTDWEQIVARIRTPRSYDRKEDCQLIKLATFGDKQNDKHCLRYTENLINITGVEGDYDGEKISISDASLLIAAAGIEAVFYTSPSHTPERPRWRILCPLSKPHPPADRAGLLAKVNGVLGGILGNESFTQSQSFFIGKVNGMKYDVQQTRGKCIDEIDGLPEVYPPKHQQEQAKKKPRHDDDPVLRRLEERGYIKSSGKDHSVNIICPFSSSHTQEDKNETATVYLPPHTGRYATGRIVCLHGHCVNRSMDEYRVALGLPVYAKAVPEQHHKPPGAPNIEVGESVTFGELLKKQMKDIMHYSKPWISEGVTLLAGRPKIGKTTLARQLSICIGEGKQFLNSDTKKSKVLFLSLEENERIFRRKLEMMGCPDTLDNCIVFFEWPRGKEGAAQLGKYLDEHPEIEVIIIDSLTRIRDLPTADKNIFMQDYEAMRMFHTMLSSLTGKALIMLHQTRKGKAEDPIEDISGSFGLTAACDSYFVFRTEKDGKYVIHCGGRLWDCDDSAFELNREGNIWCLLSPYEASHLMGDGLTDEQKETLEWLNKTGGMGPTELGQALKISPAASYYRLNGLIRKQKAKKEKGIYYAL